MYGRHGLFCVSGEEIELGEELESDNGECCLQADEYEPHCAGGREP